MNQIFSRLTITSIIIALFTSCGSEQSDSDKTLAEKITFPEIKFIIDATADTTIFGPQGTRIFIEKETFQFPDGATATDSIELTLKEFYSKSDIILANLSTESDGKLLETGGMLNISARSNGQDIEIKSDKRIVIHFPKSNKWNAKMDLFYADSNVSDSSSVSNWNVDTINLVKKTLKLGSYGWWRPSYDDSTSYDFVPKNYVDSGYYWNPLDFYISAYNFTPETRREIETNMNKNSYPDFDSWNDFGVECEMTITTEGNITGAKVVSNVSKSTKKEILKFLNGLPQLQPGKNKYGKIIERRGLLFIQGGNVIPLYKTNEDYVKSFDMKYSKFEKKPIKNLDDAELNYYIFSVAKLGWINCDRFLESEQTLDYFVQTPIETGTKIKMIFSDIDGVLEGKVNEGKFVFSKVPTGMRVTIVAIKDKEGQLQTAFQDITISDKPLVNLAFKETTLAELKGQLEKLN